MSDAKVKILCVDDDPNLLDGLRRNLRKQFDVRTEEGGAEGLAAIDETDGGFAVIVSDLRMPNMNGIEFLTKVRDVAPDTTRVLLTGDADLTSAMAAVNEGNIFRFLTKPCSATNLIPAIDAAAEHHRLVTAEKELLEKTLHGSVTMLTEVLSLASPASFGHATRLRKMAGELAAALGETERWKVELATTLSQAAHISLPGEVLKSLREGEQLSDAEQKMVDRLPAVAVNLIAAIPRLGDVEEILRRQDERFDTKYADGDTQPPMGARILRSVIDFDNAQNNEVSADAAIETLQAQVGRYDPKVLAALAEIHASGSAEEGEVRHLKVAQLIIGMVLLDPVVDSEDRLLVASGQEVSVSLSERLRNFASNMSVKEPIRVLVKPSQS